MCSPQSLNTVPQHEVECCRYVYVVSAPIDNAFAELLRGPDSPDCPCRPESNITDILAVNIGCELLKIVPGRVRPAWLVVWRKHHK